MTTGSISASSRDHRARWTRLESPSIKTKSRRIPPSLRKRAAFSCDRCKTRRRKCVPSSSGPICQLCSDNGAFCTTTIPRKRYPAPKTSPAKEDVSHPSLFTERLIAMLFPEVETGDVSQLAHLTEYVENTNLQIRVSGNKLSVTSNDPLAQFVIPSSMSVSRTLGQLSHSLDNGESEFDPAASERSHIPALPSPNQFLVNKRERLLQNSSGTLCYFGPSSSMAFVMQLREEVVPASVQNPENIQPKQQRLRQRFAADGSCFTMENISQVEDFPDQDQDQRNTKRSHSVYAEYSSDRSIQSQSAIQDQQHRFADLLPPRQEVEELVNLYFAHIHPNMVLFHRPLFQSALESFWTSSQDFKDVDWLTCCCLVIVLGCKHATSTSGCNNSRSQSLRALQQNLVQMALGNVMHLIQFATLQSVQALALLSLYLNIQNQRNASWIIMGCAIRMATSLGMHRSEKLIPQIICSTPVERELKKRVWWSLYIFEQYNCALFGRPSAIDDLETTNDLPSESILDEGYYQPPGLLHHDVCLARIVGRIRKLQADPKRGSSVSGGGSTSCLPDIQAVRTILHELDIWYDELPPFLKIDALNKDAIYPGHFRPLVIIRLRYQHAKLLLTRPFHLKVLQQQCLASEEEVALEFGDVCVVSALESWQLSQQLSKAGRFNGDIWLDGVFLYQAGMILALACLDTQQKLNVSKSSNERRFVYQAIESILKMLHDIPQDNSMGRMVQIVDDFSKIVRSMRSDPATAVLDKGNRRSDLQDSSVRLSYGDEISIPESWPQLNELRTNSGVEYQTSLDMLARTAGPLRPVEEGGEFNSAHRDGVYPAYTWHLEGTQIMDYMLDCDLSQIFGFDGGGEISTFSV